MGFEFPVYTDRFNCNSKVYNSKITSISYFDLKNKKTHTRIRWFIERKKDKNIV